MPGFPQKKVVVPASLFERPLKPEPRIIGLEKMEGLPALQLPFPCRILAVDFQASLVSHLRVASVRLELAPIKAAHLRLQLWFRNIRDLAIPRLPSEGAACAYFQIEDCRDLGREKMNWKVYDLNSDAISFFAEEAEILSVVLEG
jgi:hypothetical protein